MRSLRSVCLALSVIALSVFAAPAHSENRITIIVDAFGPSSDLRQDWGYSALIEHAGKRILFDTGNNADLFAENSALLGVDLRRLDFVVISHRHGDHTDGLHHLLKINPRIKIYTANDEYFGGPTPAAFFQRSVPSLPERMRYFGGEVPQNIPHGSPWKHANLERVYGVLEIAPGVRLVNNRARTGPFSETPELSLAIDTPEGQLLFVGCSHPGIEQILGSVNAMEDPVRLVVGGLHLVTTDDAEIERLAIALRDDWKVTAVAPGHCTGEAAFAALQRAYDRRYVYAGVGTVIDVPTSSGHGTPEYAGSSGAGAQ